MHVLQQYVPPTRSCSRTSKTSACLRKYARKTSRKLSLQQCLIALARRSPLTPHPSPSLPSPSSSLMSLFGISQSPGHAASPFRRGRRRMTTIPRLCLRVARSCCSQGADPEPRGHCMRRKYSSSVSRDQQREGAMRYKFIMGTTKRHKTRRLYHDQDTPRGFSRNPGMRKICYSVRSI